MTDWSALLVSLVFVVVSVGALGWLNRRQVDAPGPFISIILASVALFLVLTERLESFKLGDFAGTISATARAPVSVTELVATEVTITPADMSVVRNEMQAMFEAPRSVILLRVADWEVPAADLAELLRPAFWLGFEIQNALLNNQIRAVIVVDDHNRPLGVFAPAFFLDLLNVMFGAHLPQAEKNARLKQTGLWHLLLSPERNSVSLGRPSWISASTSNARALELMREHDWDVVAVVNEQLAVTGVATRARVLETLTLGAVTATRN